ncbi:hypothetical protein Agsp01_02270 [Agromyces sp. NBRC 114283]|nr:hypothetical protein [Agromyces mediolanus]GLU87972.1 hypothetical protein Agsp01_02270 [Agromyces sp. NBRC 114283]
MIVTRREHPAGDSPRRGYAGLIDKLNAKLLPYIGPPPLGPYDEEPVAERPPACPLCGKPMSEHDIDRSGERTQLHCPT